MRETTKIISDWIERMTDRYGSGVIDKETGQHLDWGQALARERYGLDWDAKVPDTPTKEDVERALAWETGDWPEWAEQGGEP